MGMDREEQLVRGLKRREKGVLETLYNTYAPPLLSICLRYCGNREDAEDILHDGFMKIILHIHTFKAQSTGSFEGWMKRIIVNTSLNFIRDHSKEKRFLDVDTMEEMITSEEEMEDHDRERVLELVGKEHIIEMICDLPPGYRTIFNMFVFEQYSHHEIAKLLDCSVNTSKSQLSKARRALRQRILEVVEKQKAI